MKCELAAALLHQPKVLFLDEPTIGLDDAARTAVDEMMLHASREGRTLVIATHQAVAPGLAAQAGNPPAAPRS